MAVNFKVINNLNEGKGIILRNPIGSCCIMIELTYYSLP
jgi:hypothetical protein